MTRLGVVIPTVPGREAMLARTVQAYLEHTPPDVHVQVVVLRTYPTCGEAWNAGARLLWNDGLPPDWFTMGADDLVPRAGWYEPLEDAAQYDMTGAPAVYNGHTGGLESCGIWGATPLALSPVPWTPVPFCAAVNWRDIPPIHYFSDNAYGSAMQAQGLQIVAAPASCFDHYWSQEARQPMNSPRWHEERALWEAYHRGLGLQ